LFIESAKRTGARIPSEMLNNGIEIGHGARSICAEVSALTLTGIDAKRKGGNARGDRACLDLKIKIKTFDAAFPPWVITGKIIAVARKTDVSLEDEKVTSWGLIFPMVS